MSCCCRKPRTDYGWRWIWAARDEGHVSPVFLQEAEPRMCAGRWVAAGQTCMPLRAFELMFGPNSAPPVGGKRRIATARVEDSVQALPVRPQTTTPLADSKPLGVP